MVEAVAASLKPKLEEFLNSAEETEPVEGWEWNVSMHRKIQNARQLLTFLNGDWKENLVTRNGYQSVEEVRRQEVALVGGQKVMKRIEMNIKRKIADPVFLKEQLKLFKFRMKFFWAFFPRQAQLYEVFGTIGFIPREIQMEERFGWWNLDWAGCVLRPEYAIVGKHFHRVVRTAFHMTGTEVNFDDLEDDEMDFDDSDDEMDYIDEGQDYYTRFDLLFVDREVEDEIHNLKVHSTTYADEHANCQEIRDSYGFLKEVVWTLHKPSPPPLQELAAKAIHLHFPKATMKQKLPIPLVQYLLSGPKLKYAQLSLRGQRIWNALVEEEEERLEESRKMEHYHYFQEMVHLEAELEQEEVNEMERQMELEQEELGRRIDDYQNFHELAGLDVELEQEEIDQIQQNEKEGENEIEMERQIELRERQLELEQEELNTIIEDYQNSQEF